MVFLGFDYRIKDIFLAGSLGFGFPELWYRDVSEEKMPKVLFLPSGDCLMSRIKACFVRIHPEVVSARLRMSECRCCLAESAALEVWSSSVGLSGFRKLFRGIPRWGVLADFVLAS